MANRQSAKSNILSLNVPTVTNSILNDMLNSELADNVRFREDVSVAQSSTTSNISVNFAGKDRIDLTRTGGNLNITVSGIGDGEDKDLYITKTAGQAVTFVDVIDITPIKANANAALVVLYRITRKSSSYYAIAWVENVKTATETIEGVLEVGTVAECNALSVIDKIVTPGRIPISSDTQRGLAERATAAECNALSDTERIVTPGRIPKATETQAGVARAATDLEVFYGTDVVGSITNFVQPSQAKQIKDDASAALDATSVLAFTGTPNANLTINTLNGRRWHKFFHITGNIINSGGSGSTMFVKHITGYISPGYNVLFPICAVDNIQETGTGYIDTNGDIYIKPQHTTADGWVFNVTMIGI